MGKLDLRFNTSAIRLDDFDNTKSVSLSLNIPPIYIRKVFPMNAVIAGPAYSNLKNELIKQLIDQLYAELDWYEER